MSATDPPRRGGAELRNRGEPRLTNAPDISVIVPTRNRLRQIQRCLRALAAQTYPRDRFEVIVVDDGGDTPLGPAIMPFRAHLGVQLVTQKNAGPAVARNAGAKDARGTLLAFTDDDCEPSPGWLTALHEHFEQWPDRAIGGDTANGLPNNAWSTASQLLVDYLYEHHATVAAKGGSTALPFFTSNNFSVPAALFRRIGGFDESFGLAAGEDREFFDRWQENGYGLLRAPNAIVQHSHPLSCSRFWRQHTNYGRGAFQLQSARAARGRPALRIEPLSFYLRLLTYPMRTSRRQSPPMLIALLFVSQVANAMGFVSEKRRSRIRMG